MIKKGTMMKFEGILFTFLLISVVLLSGCTSPNQNSNQNVPISYPVFSTIDSNILHTAYADYDVLRNSMNASDARAALLETLKNETVGVEEAELGVDGSTIFVTFSDGDFAMVDTFEVNEEPAQGTGFSYPIGGEVQSDDYLEKNTMFFDTVPSETSGYTPRNIPGKTNYDLIIVGVNNKTTCTSKKVLVLAPCYWEFKKQPTDACISLFKEHGWSDEDITLKLVKENPTDPNFDCNFLTPEDYFNLEKYGIILFTGHGAIKAFKNFEEDNLYLQFCYADNASFLKNPLLQQWKDAKTLRIAHEYRAGKGNSSRYIYDTFIRADLLRQKIGTLPSSYMSFATCFGSFFNEMYLEKGAKIFLSWDKSVEAYHADANMLAMVQNMLENDVRVYDAYLNHSVVKSYDIWDPGNPVRGLIPAYPPTQSSSFLKVNFYMYPDPHNDSVSFSYYFPAWVNIHAKAIPEGTSSLRIIISDNKSKILSQGDIPVGSGQTESEIHDVGGLCFPASERYILEVKALSATGGILSASNFSATLLSGENIFHVSFVKSYWYLSGGEEPKTNINITPEGMTTLIVSVNGVRAWNAFEQSSSQSLYYTFNANAGDPLNLQVVGFPEKGECYSLGPLWLQNSDTGKKVKLTDGVDMGCWEGAEDSVVILYQTNYTIPNI